MPTTKSIKVILFLVILGSWGQTAHSTATSWDVSGIVATIACCYAWSKCNQLRRYALKMESARK